MITPTTPRPAPQLPAPRTPRTRMNMLVTCSVAAVLVVGGGLYVAALGHQGGHVNGVAARAHASPTPHLSPTPHPGAGGPTEVSVTWGDSTGLARWPAVPGAAQYAVTLIRMPGQMVMEQFLVPAAQLAADVQGIWPGEQYEVAVQTVNKGGQLSEPTYSPVGQPQPIDRSQYNGFLDQMNIAAGNMDHNLWDERRYIPGASTAETFINGQIHGHLMTGQIAYEQSLVSLTSRVPFDFTDRTGHLHGEVDLHGDRVTWFAAVLAPSMISGNQFVDIIDRNYIPHNVPLLEIFDGQNENQDHGSLNLFEAVPNGHNPYIMANNLTPDFSLLNVRNTLDWYVSTSHMKLVIDGQTLFDQTLPATLPFSKGYLTLIAESYPKPASDVLGHVPTCDQAGGDCNVWHLDNWGFDAPQGVSQPATTVNYDLHCPPPSTAENLPDHATHDMACNGQSLGTSATTYSVKVPDAGQTANAQVVFSLYGYDKSAPTALRVSVNGSQWLPVDVPDTTSVYDSVGMVTLPPGVLRTGDNTIQFRTVSPVNSMQVANVLIQQVRSYAYHLPPLPLEPAPLQKWNGALIKSLGS